MPTTHHAEIKRFPSTPEPDGSVWTAIWLYLRYHLLTKSLFLFGIIPLFQWATNALIHSTGKDVISHDEFLSLALTWQGIALITLFVGLVVLAIATDISAFIIMEATHLLRGRFPGVFPTLGQALRAIIQFAKPSTLLLIGYMVLVVPLSGVGLSIGPLRKLALPVQAQEAIHANPIYHNIYYVALACFIIASLFLIFTFHFVLLHNNTPWEGMLASVQFVAENAWSLGKLMIVRIIKFAGLIGGITVIGALILSALKGIDLIDQVQGFTTVAWVVIAMQANGVILFILLPRQIANLTRLFVTYHTPPETDVSHTASMAFHLTFLPEPPEHPAKYPHVFVAAFILADILLNGVGAYQTLVQVDDIALARTHIGVIANHRPKEHQQPATLADIQTSIDQGVPEVYVEVYQGANGQLYFDSETTANQLVTQVTPRAAMIVVLANGTTDDALAALIQSITTEGFQAQVTIASEDYPLLERTKAVQPDLRTAFISNMSVGDFNHLNCDAVILESFAVNQGVADQLHNQGKFVLLLSAKNTDAMAFEVHNKVDAIITDHPVALQQALSTNEGRSDLDLIIDAIFK